MKNSMVWPLSLIAATFFAINAHSARAFDTQPHFDITRDALATEGFSDTAIGEAQVTNWFNDLYENPDKIPYSGYASTFKELVTLAYGDREHWSQPVRTAASRAHFDSDSGVTDTANVEREWNRVARSTRAALLNRAAVNDSEGMLAVVGSSLHVVQDFYTHSNWVEPRVAGDTNYARSGPGWAAQRTWGSHPTWFDVPAAERNKHRIYCTGQREHGSWNSDNNANLNSLNKDWAGRPSHEDAYVTAYIASRQWVRALRVWLNDDTKWNRMRQFSNRHGDDLDHDLKGTFEISYYSGHWNGNGEPTGSGNSGPGASLFDLRGAVRNYFEDYGRSAFRSKWEQVILLLDNRNPPAVAAPVASSLDIRNGLEFMVAQIVKIKEIDDRDFGPLDEADWYGQAVIGGQQFRSGFINGEDDFDFGVRPYGPFTYIKALPAGTAGVPITLKLFDEDSPLHGDDDHCDISPVRGRKDLTLVYNRATNSYAGDLSGNAISPKTVRGAGDDDIAEITFLLHKISIVPPPAPSNKRVTVTFQSVRLVDPTRNGRHDNARFTFSVNGQSKKQPANGTVPATVGSALNLPANFSFTVRPSTTDTMQIKVGAVDESKVITTSIIEFDNRGKPHRITTTAPLELSLNRGYAAANFGGPDQTYTERSVAKDGAYFEVTYRIGVRNEIPVRGNLGAMGTLELPPKPPRQPQPRPRVPRAPVVR